MSEQTDFPEDLSCDFNCHFSCDQGAFRPNNEDAICTVKNKALSAFCFIIADGMGGHQAGEVASNIVVTQLEQQFTDLQALPSQGWLNWIKQQLSSANVAIYERAQSQARFQGMGTTAVVAVLFQKQCYVGWVGDSRAYLFSTNHCQQLTQDHTMIQYLLNKGAISASEAENANTKNMLSRALGVKDEVEVDLLSTMTNPSDILMLSTDGLHDYLTVNEITGYMSQYAQKIDKNLPDNMVKQAIKQGSKDNVTLGLVKIS